jgi:hypothetical protein
MLPKTIDFSLNVRGMPNDIIRIACVDCTIAEFSEMEAILNPLDFEYNNRGISIRTEQLDWIFNEIKEDTDTLFFFNKTRIILHEAKIRNFLKDGGSVMLLSDLAQSDVDGPVGSLFNLTWGAPTGSPPRTFHDIYDAKNISHFIAKYYANLTGKYLENVPSDTFSAFNANSIIAVGDTKTIIRNTGTRAFVRANFDIEKSWGRSVWFSDYTRLNHNDSDTRTIDNALKASLMWASGEYYSMDTVKKYPAPVHFKSSIIIYDTDTYIFELIVWRAFF